MLYNINFKNIYKCTPDLFAVFFSFRDEKAS